MTEFDGQRVLVVGGSKYLGQAVARAAAAAGADVIIGARDIDRATDVAGSLGGTAVRIDIADEASITAAVAEVGAVDHIVVTASAHHSVPVAEFERDKIVAAFEAKVIGPMLLAKHFAPVLPTTGSLTLFSGVAAWNPAAGYAVMGVTNGAVSFLVTHLAKELTPIRVNAISPGIIDSGTWDGLGDGKRQLLEGAAASNLAGRAGTTGDIADSVVWLLGAGFVSGETIHVEGGARHA